MSLVPDKLRKAKKLVDVDKLDAFVDEGLASQEPKPAPKRRSRAAEPPQSAPDPKPKATRPSRSPKTLKAPSEAPSWKQGMNKAPSVAFSVRIPTPLLERMRDVIAAVDGETLTSLLVEGAADRVSAIETSYQKQVGESLPERKAKVEL